LLLIGVLFIGKRLPEIAGYLAKGVDEFRKGLVGLQDELEETAARMMVGLAAVWFAAALAVAWFRLQGWGG
jgi:hypothetical protein